MNSQFFAYFSKLSRKDYARMSAVAVLTVLTLNLFSFASAPVKAADSALDAFRISEEHTLESGIPTAAGSFSNGVISNYTEGSCIPMLITAENNPKGSEADGEPDDLSVSVSFDHYNEVTGIDSFELITFSGDPNDSTNLNEFTYTGQDLSEATQFTSVSETISGSVEGPFSDTAGTTSLTGTDATGYYNILLEEVPEEDEVYILFCARLGDNAGDYNGASMGVQLDGGSNLPISPNSLINLPSVTVYKSVFENDSADLSQFSFTVTNASTGETVETFSIDPATGSYTVNVPEDGSYIVTEIPTEGYEILEGGREDDQNCTFDKETLTSTATVEADTDEDVAEAKCYFVNGELELPTVMMEKIVINDDGTGTLSETDFTFTIDDGDETTDAVEAVDGESVSLAPGTYTVTENGDMTNYTSSFGDDCLDGTFTIAYGDALTCTVTNDDIAAEAPSEDENDDDTPPADPVDDGGETEDPVDEENDDDTPPADPVDNGGEDEETNDEEGDGDDGGSHAPIDEEEVEEPAHVIVKIVVVNENGQTLTPSDFTYTITMGDDSETESGNSAGNDHSFDGGTYSVAQLGMDNYLTVKSEECEGTISGGEETTCTITNYDIAAESSEESSGGGGGGSHGDPNLNRDTEDDAPEPQVLGETDEADESGEEAGHGSAGEDEDTEEATEETTTDPVPQVLGETDELPRTGSSAALALLAGMSTTLFLARREKQQK